MTWRDLAWLLVSATVGFALSLLAVLLFLLVVTWGAVVVRRRADHDGPIGLGPVVAVAYGHTEVLEQRVRRSPRPAPRASTTRPPSCGGSSATCTTARRPGSSPWA